MSSKHQLGSTSVGLPAASERAATLIGRRYEILEQLGRGGMAVVYLARDLRDGRELALKHVFPQTAERDRIARVHLEREFQLLAQLSHPSVIEVYDYGIEADYPYYTMELLDGGDLSVRAPLDPQKACEIVVQLCSSLSLLHSRRLVHRDITPRNVRCTRDGGAKLIDFGAMAPMGLCTQSVGTPSFVAPEVVHHMLLDARTDLFSLGATLYFALTGRKPFAARTLADLNEAWRQEPTPPSELAPGIVPALDALVLSLLRIDPARRPQSAFEVTQRLTAISGSAHAKPQEIARAYLHAPELVGRRSHMQCFRRLLRRALKCAGGTLLFEGEPGSGRTRMLDVCAIEAKLAGATVIRVDGRALANSPLQTARRLVGQLSSGAAEPSQREMKRHSTIADCASSVRAACAQRPVVAVIDDLERVDDASLRFVATLAQQAHELKLLLLATLAPGAEIGTHPLLDAVRDQVLIAVLEPWSAQETEQLFTSMFFGAAHAALMGHRVHQVAAGNPRESIALAQDLLERQVIRHEDGNWVLPGELALSDLPANTEAAVRARMAALSPLARRLAQTQALAFDAPFEREDYAVLASAVEPAQVEEALGLLVRQRVLVCNAGSYTMSHVGVRAHLAAELSETAQIACHKDLAALCLRSARPKIAAVHHLLLAHDDPHALDRLTEMLNENPDVGSVYHAPGVSRTTVVTILERARALSEALGRPVRERHEIARWLLDLGLTTGGPLYPRYASTWLARLERDSGYGDYTATPNDAPPKHRLTQALERAAARYAATPAHDRVYGVEEAISLLTQFVLSSTAIATRTSDTALYATLPQKLEPFVGLSPVVDAAQQLVLAARELNCTAQPERALERLVAAHAMLGRHPDATTASTYTEVLPYSLAQTAAVIEVMLGLQTAERWIDIVERHPLYRLAALNLRRVLCIYDGDPASAERYRKEFDLLAIQTEGRGIHTARPLLELSAQLHAQDLSGVTAVADRIAQIAKQHSGWVPLHHYAHATVQRLRGDPEAALTAVEHALKAADPDTVDPPPQLNVWLQASALYVALLTELDRAREGRARGLEALERCRRLDIMGQAPIVRALALAEAKLGLHAQAAQRIDALIEQRAELRPWRLVADYEARARAAIAARDAGAAARYIELTVQHCGAQTAAGAATAGRLRDEAERAGLRVAVAVSHVESAVLASAQRAFTVNSVHPAVASVARLAHASARASRVLSVLAEASGAQTGYLYYVLQDQVSCVARLGGEHNPTLDRLASEYVDQRRERVAMTTLFSDIGDLAEPSTVSWIDPNGITYRVAPLQHEHSDSCLGLLVLCEIPEWAFGAEQQALARKLSARLLELGDIPKPSTGPAIL